MVIIALVALAVVALLALLALKDVRAAVAGVFVSGAGTVIGNYVSAQDLADTAKSLSANLPALNEVGTPNFLLGALVALFVAFIAVAISLGRKK